MPHFKITGADRATGNDYIEVVDVPDLQAAKAHAAVLGILVADVSFAPKEPLTEVVVSKTAAASTIDLQALPLNEIAEYIKRIHYWVRFFGIAAVIGLILGFVDLIFAIIDAVSRSHSYP